MSVRIEGEVVEVGEATRKSRTTEVTFKTFSIRTTKGELANWADVKLELPIARSVSVGIKGVFYMNVSKFSGNALFGYRTFDAGSAFDWGSTAINWLIILLWMVFGMATLPFYGLGLLFIGVGFYAWRQQAHAAHARRLFREDGVAGG